jgi:hypothetical protein
MVRQSGHGFREATDGRVGDLGFDRSIGVVPATQGRIIPSRTLVHQPKT